MQLDVLKVGHPGLAHDRPDHLRDAHRLTEGQAIDIAAQALVQPRLQRLGRGRGVDHSLRARGHGDPSDHQVGLDADADLLRLLHLGEDANRAKVLDG